MYCIFHEKLTQFAIVIFDSLCSDLTENAYLDLNLGKDLCSSRKHPYQPQKVNRKFQVGEGSKAQFFKGKYDAQLELPEGGGGSS